MTGLVAILDPLRLVCVGFGDVGLRRSFFAFAIPAANVVLATEHDQRDVRVSRAGTGLAFPTSMVITLESNEATVVREILASALEQLRLESARADSHDFRQMLHARERVVEHVLAQVATLPGTA